MEQCVSSCTRSERRGLALEQIAGWVGLARVGRTQLQMFGHGSGCRIQMFHEACRFQTETGELFVSIKFASFVAPDSERLKALTGKLFI